MPAGLADRLVEPYVAEAKAALAEGIVADADLVDAGAIFGTGFAPFRGGPLHYAASRANAGAAAAEPVPVVYDSRSRRVAARADERRRRTRPKRAGACRRRSARTRRGGAIVDKIWLKHYPKGVPAEIDVNEYASVREVFEESVRQVRGAARVHLHGQDDHASPSSTRCRPRSARGCRRTAARRARASRS